MDQKRLITAIAISIAILLGFQWLGPKPPPRTTVAEATKTTPSGAVPPPVANPAYPGTEPVAVTPPLSAQPNAPRVKIVAPRVEGSIDLAGARLDDLVLRDYREQVSPDSPLVRVLEPRADPQPYYVQYGWTAEGGVKVPGSDDVWTASGGELTVASTRAWAGVTAVWLEASALMPPARIVLTTSRSANVAGDNPGAIPPWS